MPKYSPIVVRLFKEEAELEVWKQDTTGRFQILKTYPICRWSGDLGPKLYEGDRQAPEGFYTVTPELMNPNSNFISRSTSATPTASTRRTSATAAPHYRRRLLVERLLCHDRRTDQRNLFAGARLAQRPAVVPGPGLSVPPDAGEFGAASKQSEPEPSGKCSRSATIISRRRNANPRWMCATAATCSMRNRRRIRRTLSCSTRNEKCPPFIVNPEIARRAQEKQRADERAYAQLVEDNLPVAPIYSGLDGGMNKAFLAKFPGRVTLAKVMPYASYLPQLPPIPWIDNDGSLTSRWFGVSFSKPVVCDAARAGFPSSRC